MKIKWIWLFTSLGIIALLTSCGGGPPISGGTNGEQATPPGKGGGGGPTPTTTYPECPPETLIPASLVYPQNMGVISNLQPMFEWASPGYSATPLNEPINLCNTEAFHIYLSSGPLFQDVLGGETSGVPPFDSLYTRTWTPGTPLEPGREYRWSITPVSMGVEGPVSDVRTFFTGPACDSDILTAPIPLSPLNYWTIDDLGSLLLTWWYPEECLPDHYIVEMSPMLQFDGSPLNETTDGPNMYWAPTNTLEDCVRYFWRVRAVVDGHEGPLSQVYNFKVDLTGSCPVSGHGTIQGTVWEDQCAGPDVGTPIPDPLPLGCAYTAEDTLFTNQTYDPGEPGIPGLVVSLGLGACPISEIFRDVITWQGGVYDFYLVPAGTYCVSVDTKISINAPILLPGGFTVPAEAIGNAVANRTVIVGAGEDVKGVDFGWWYKYGTAWGSTNATVFGQVWHDMCAYTPGDPIPDPLPEGCLNDEGVVQADRIHQDDEPGIEGVLVDIGPGDCPSAGLATATTNIDGYYVFHDLAPGKYCLRIDPAHGSPNEAILMPGKWTVVPSGHEGMTFRAITLIANHTLPGQDFGWDFDNLPAEPGFTLNINAYCREGPDIRFHAITSGVAGQTFVVLGRNQQDTWYFVRFMANLDCWFARSGGTLFGDSSRFPVFTGPPLPTLVPVCSEYKDKSTCEANLCTWVNTSPAGVGGIGYCK